MSKFAFIIFQLSLFLQLNKPLSQTNSIEACHEMTSKFWTTTFELVIKMLNSSEKLTSEFDMKNTIMNSIYQSSKMIRSSTNFSNAVNKFVSGVSVFERK